MQDSCIHTDADLAEKLLGDVIIEDSKQCVEDSDNEAVEVLKETETQELPYVSTIKLSIVTDFYILS